MSRWISSRLRTDVFALLLISYTMFPKMCPVSVEDTLMLLFTRIVSYGPTVYL